MTFKTFGGKTTSWLLGYDSFGATWHIKAKSPDGLNHFFCDTSVFINPNYRLETQLQLIRRVARCLT